MKIFGALSASPTRGVDASTDLMIILCTGKINRSTQNFSVEVKGAEGGVMVRADISWRAKTPLHFCASNIDAQAYTNMLDATYQG